MLYWVAIRTDMIGRAVHSGYEETPGLSKTPTQTHYFQTVIVIKKPHWQRNKKRFKMESHAVYNPPSMQRDYVERVEDEI